MSQYTYDPYAPVRETNGLGIAGFVCSLVGLLTGGILSPVGLILSLVAMGRGPRGFAIAGLVLGLVGTCGGILLFVFAGAAVLALLGIAVVAIALSEPEKVELTSEMANIAIAVEQYKDTNRYVPADPLTRYGHRSRPRRGSVLRLMANDGRVEQRVRRTFAAAPLAMRRIPGVVRWCDEQEARAQLEVIS